MTELTAADLAQWWAADRRWAGIARTFTAEDVVRLAGTAAAEHSADAEPGFGGHLTVFELTRAMIAAGAAGIHGSPT